MHQFAFLYPGVDLAGAYDGVYSPVLVLLSLAIATLAAYTSFSHVGLIRATRRRWARLGWHVNGALTMGAGVWAMHFTGMLALELPLAVGYDLDWTLLSVLPATLAGYVTLAVLLRQRPSLRAILAGGLLMGSGIGAMHYIGMGALILEARLYYHPALFAASIGLAIVMATLALSIRSLLKHFLDWGLMVKLSSSLVMGLAVSSMHYVAMLATVYLPSGQAVGESSGLVLSDDSLAWVALTVAVFILSISSLAAQLRRRILDAERSVAFSEQHNRHLYDRLNAIADRVPGMVYQFRRHPDGSYCFPYTSDAIRTIYGVTPDAVVETAEPILAVIHPEDRQALIDSIELSARELTPWQHQYRVRLAGTRQRWLMGNAVPQRLADGSVEWNGFIMDITEQKEAEATIERLAYYDDLTGLPNRRLLLDRLAHSLAAARRAGDKGALFFVDLDGFKRLNDLQGHALGDRLLVEVGQRLVQAVHTDDSVARLGGDEFVVVVERIGPDVEQAAFAAERLARKLLEHLSSVFDLDGFEYRCAASIGISLLPAGDGAANEVLKQADIAMYQAKAAGGSGIRFFDPEMTRAMEARFELENDLRLALAQRQFRLHLQKQVDQDGGLVGAEALIRWQHPRRGLIGPGEFIPLAEDTGLIVPLGDWVLETACNYLRQWHDDPATADLTLSVNVSARQFHQDDFVERVSARIDRAGIDPHRLKLELTESLVLEDLDDTLIKVTALRERGVRLSMDDFGTGYSSLSYLSRLPFDEVKIDKAFIHSAGAHDREWVIIEAIIGIGRKLGMAVMAEGVEDAAQYRQLHASQCFLFQGYYFGRPTPLEAFMAELD